MNLIVQIYTDAYNEEIAGDKSFYNDVKVQDVLDEMAQLKTCTWFKQIYCKFTKGQDLLEISLAVRSTVGSHSLGSISNTRSLVEKENNSQLQ